MSGRAMAAALRANIEASLKRAQLDLLRVSATAAESDRGRVNVREYFTGLFARTAFPAAEALERVGVRGVDPASLAGLVVDGGPCGESFLARWRSLDTRTVHRAVRRGVLPGGGIAVAIDRVRLADAVHLLYGRGAELETEAPAGRHWLVGVGEHGIAITTLRTEPVPMVAWLDPAEGGGA